MSRKIINALLLTLSLSAFAHAGGVTNIKEVVNNSSKAIRVTAYDNKSFAENGRNDRITTAVTVRSGRDCAAFAINTSTGSRWAAGLT